MKDESKTKSQLISELKKIREEITSLKKHKYEPKGKTATKNSDNGRNVDNLGYATIATESLPIFFKINCKGIFTLSEGKMLSSLGLKPGQVVGLSAYELYKDYPAIIRGIKTSQKGNTFHENISINTPNGEKIFDLLMSPDYNLRKEITGTIGMGIDVTESIKLQNAIRENERRLNETQKLTKIGGWEYDIRTGKMFWTDEVYRIHELPITTEGDLVKISLKCYPPESKQIIEKAFKSAFITGRSYDHELRFITTKGNKRWIRTVGRVIKKNGEPFKIIGNIMDITEKKKTEQALRSSEVKFRTFSDFSPIAKSIILGNNYLYVNRAWKKLTGYSKKDAATMSPFAVVHPDMRDMVRERATARLRGAAVPSNYEMKLLTKKGETKWVDFSVSLIDYEDTKAIVVLAADISERKKFLEDLQKAETEYRELSEKLMKSNNLKDLLFDIITHDLRNPAGIIDAYTNLALDQDPANEILIGISNSSKKLVEVLEEAVLLVQATNEESIAKQKLDIKSLINESIVEFSVPIKNKGTTIIVKCKRTFTIQGNPILKEAIKNLVANALKYAPKSKKIVIEAHKDKRNALIKIIDYGKTIPKDKREVIFERGFRADKRNRAGRGIGLAITKRIVEAHNGEIWVEPTRPNGNAFCILLPVKNK